MTIAPSHCARGSEPTARRRRSRPLAAQHGLSLVEIMVAMAIGLFIVLIATTIYIQGASNVSFRVGQSENLGNSRYALGALDNEFTKAGFRRDPTQPMEQAFPADADAFANGCKFLAGEAINLKDGDLCIRFQARDNLEKDCAGDTAGIPSLIAYEAPAAPALGAGMFVEKYLLYPNGDKHELRCQAGKIADKADAMPVADGVRAILFEFGVGTGTDSTMERKVESFKTTAPTSGEVIRSLRYAVLLASSKQGLTAGMESSVCTRWAQLGGSSDSCKTDKGELYQLASGSLTLRNLMP